MTDDDVTASCLRGCELHGRHLPLACCPAPCCNGCDCPTHSQICTSCFHCAIATVQVWLWMKQWVHVFTQTHTHTHTPCSPGTPYLPVCVWQIGGRGLCSLRPEEMAVKTTGWKNTQCVFKSTARIPYFLTLLGTYKFNLVHTTAQCSQNPYRRHRQCASSPAAPQGGSGAHHQCALSETWPLLNCWGVV